MTVRRLRSSRLVAPVAALVVLAALASVAFARGGGGGNFGGGGSGGGGGGGGDGIGFLIWMLLRLCIEYPLIGIPLLIVFVVVAVKHASSMREGFQAGVIRRGSVAASTSRAADLAEQIRERDPAFDFAAFDGRVRAAFVKVQNAWCAQDLTAIRAFVSDGVYERFSMQIEEERALGYRDKMESLQVLQSRLVYVGFEGAFDAVTVRVGATAADYRVSLATGERVSGSTAPDVFAEFWTFLRRRGTKSLVGAAGLMEGNCPNCGDAIEGNQFADCKSCHARLRGGEYDWVLVEITQDGEWSEPSSRRMPGVAELAAADPEFCVEALEDRASVAFWRWATAMRVGDAKPLAGVASDEVVRSVAASCAAGGVRRYVGECGVGGVELVGVVRDDGVDHALLDVTWSGTEFESGPNCLPRRLDRTGVKSWLFVYERAAGAKSKIGDSFSSAHCRGCGAPNEGTSTVCAFCGEALVDVNAGWTLARMTTRYEAAGRVLLDRLRGADAPEVDADAPPSAPSLVPAGVLAWAVRVAASDGVVDAKERAGLALIAQRAGVPPSRVDEIVRDALAPGGEPPPAPPTPAAAREWLEFAARIALADGVISSEEFALLSRLAAPAGVSSADVRVLVNRVKAQVYQEAKAELARAKA